MLPSKTELYEDRNIVGHQKKKEEKQGSAYFFPNHNLVLKWCNTWHPFTVKT